MSQVASRQYPAIKLSKKEILVAGDAAPSHTGAAAAPHQA
jgi:hypothetical protein